MYSNIATVLTNTLQLRATSPIQLLSIDMFRENGRQSTSEDVRGSVAAEQNRIRNIILHTMSVQMSLYHDGTPTSVRTMVMYRFVAKSTDAPVSLRP